MLMMIGVLLKWLRYKKKEDYEYFMKRFSIMEKPIRLEAGFIRPKKNGGWDSPSIPEK
jgi:hypothetical protein